MEVKFSPIAVGFFLTTLVAATVAFCFWFFSSSLFTKHTEYRVIFPSSIAGLYTGSSVTYNGVQVGQVSDISIYERFGNKVVATLSIDNRIKIKQDTFATLNMKGITGQMFIELCGGSNKSPTLEPNSSTEDMIIPYTESTLNALATAAPQILNKLSQILEKMEAMISGRNKTHIDSIVKNIDSFSKQASKLPDSLGGAITELTELLRKAQPILIHTEKGMSMIPTMFKKGTRELTPVMQDIRTVARHLNQFGRTVNDKGILAAMTGSRAL